MGKNLFQSVPHITYANLGQIVLKAIVALSTPTILNRHHTQGLKIQCLRKKRSGGSMIGGWNCVIIKQPFEITGDHSVLKDVPVHLLFLLSNASFRSLLLFKLGSS